MSFHCDWCGDLIENQRGRVTIKVHERDRRDRAAGQPTSVELPVWARLDREMGGDGCNMPVDLARATSFVMRLYRAGQSTREPETFGKTRTRYRYSVRRELRGPIVDLERAYSDEEAAREA
jgi:hypothetical protein